MNGLPNIPDFIPPSIGNALIGLGGAALINAIFGKTWGIVNEYGIPIVLADSVLGMSYDAGASISNMPIEKGSFASYNKVNNPSIATVQLAKSSGGTLQRGLFLAQIEALLKSTLKFHIISPEYVYMNYQIIGINHSRTAQEGTTLLKVNLDLQEVLEAKIEYDTEVVENPSDAQVQDGGAKQAQPAEEKKSAIAGGAGTTALGRVLGGILGR